MSILPAISSRRRLSFSRISWMESERFAGSATVDDDELAAVVLVVVVVVVDDGCCGGGGGGGGGGENGILESWLVSDELDAGAELICSWLLLLLATDATPPPPATPPAPPNGEFGCSFGDILLASSVLEPNKTKQNKLTSFPSGK